MDNIRLNYLLKDCAFEMIKRDPNCKIGADIISIADIIHEVAIKEKLNDIDTIILAVTLSKVICE